jgi:hypothetical protein
MRLISWTLQSVSEQVCTTQFLIPCLLLVAWLARFSFAVCRRCTFLFRNYYVLHISILKWRLMLWDHQRNSQQMQSLPLYVSKNLHTKITIGIKKFSNMYCSRQKKPVYSGSLLSPALCGIMGSRVICPSSTQATQCPCLSHLRLSLLAALQRYGPGGNTLKSSLSSKICDQWMPDNVHFHLFSY